MEFKYRAIDKKPPMTSFHPLSTVAYESNRLLQGAGGYSGYPTNTFRLPAAGEDLWRELEKEQIRREILSGENERRRRQLEEEVRRELAMERMQMLMATAAPYSFQERLNPVAAVDDGIIRVSQPLLQNMVYPVEFKPSSSSHIQNERVISLGFQELVKPVAAVDDNIIRVSQPQLQHLVSPVEIKPSSPDIQNQKDKIIMLPRPKSNPFLLCAKRKALPLVIHDAESSESGLMKKAKMEWKCTLCQVNATSQINLNMHLCGKKHKAMEAAKKTQMIGLDAEQNRKSPQPSLILKELNQNMVDNDVKKSVNEEQLVQKSHNVGDLESQNETEDTNQAGKTMASANRKVSLWCKVCNVRAFSQDVMDAHMRGKKHQKEMKKSRQN